jgi:pimeloyl-ACP methyl ester carboxylesterase
VFGAKDDVGLTDEERGLLGAAPHITLVEIADAGHFTLNQKPSEVAALILDAVASRTPD